MARSSVLLAIVWGVVLVLGGLVVWLVRRRKGDRFAGWVLLFGLPGLYLASLASALDAPKGLYIPGLLLMVLSAVMQLVLWRSQRANKDPNRH